MFPSRKTENSLSGGRDLSSIFRDERGYLWVGGNGAGLDRFDERSGQFKHYRHNPGDPHSLMTDDVVSLYGDPSGQLWVGEFGGASRFDPATDRFTNYRPGPIGSTSLEYTVSAFHRDHSGTLWLGTWGGILSRFNDKTNTFVNYTRDLRNPHRLQGGSIGAIHEDRAGTLWLASGQGLYRYDRRNETFIRYTEVEGLPNVDLMGILEDGAGRLWISTKKGYPGSILGRGRFETTTCPTACRAMSSRGVVINKAEMARCYFVVAMASLRSSPKTSGTILTYRR